MNLIYCNLVQTAFLHPIQQQQ